AALEPIRIRIRCVVNTRQQRTETTPLNDLARSERQRTHRATVKRAQEREDALTLGVIARQLDRSFGRLGARITEECADGTVDRRDGGQLFGQSDLRLVIEIRPRHVDEL